jgi:DNA-binding PadR family transcriptional regulator
MTRRKVSNLLALAILSLLSERPMHPYEISTTLRERHKEESIKLNYGSLYTVVESLVRAGFIVSTGTVRQGRRPERTTYAITEAGRVELDDWLSELVSTPVKEYTHFEAALSLLGVLPPAEALRLLLERRDRLISSQHSARATLEFMNRSGLPRIFMLEAEFNIEIDDAQLRYVEKIIEGIATRSLEGIEMWESFHQDEPASAPYPADRPRAQLAEAPWGESALGRLRLTRLTPPPDLTRPQDLTATPESGPGRSRQEADQHRAEDDAGAGSSSSDHGRGDDHGGGDIVR